MGKIVANHDESLAGHNSQLPKPEIYFKICCGRSDPGLHRTSGTYGCMRISIGRLKENVKVLGVIKTLCRGGIIWRRRKNPQP